MSDLNQTRTGLPSVDTELQRAENALLDPGSPSMQILQSTVDHVDQDLSTVAPASAPVSAKPTLSSASYGSNLGGVPPAFSGLGLIAAAHVGDALGAASAMGLASAVAPAAGAAMGKSVVSDSAVLSGMGDKAFLQSLPAERFSDSLPIQKPVAGTEGADTGLPFSAEFAQLMASLSNPELASQSDPLVAVMQSLGSNPSADSLQMAIDAVSEQITNLTQTFDPVFENLNTDVQQAAGDLLSVATVDLGLQLVDDAGSIADSVSSLLGSVDVISNPQIDSLLNLGSTLDDVISLVGSLPEIDLAPVIDPIGDVVGGVGDVVGGVGDVVGGVGDVVGGVGDVVGGVGDVVGGVGDVVGGVGDVVGGVGDVVGGVGDVVGGVGDVVGGVGDVLGGVGGGLGGILGGLQTSESGGAGEGGLLDGLSSGISSAAGTEDGGLAGLLGGLDPSK